MKEFIVSKNVSLTLNNVEVIRQVQAKQRCNFSKALNRIVMDWVSLRTFLHNQKQDPEREKDFKKITTAKVLK